MGLMVQALITPLMIIRSGAVRRKGIGRGKTSVCKGVLNP